jgi:hypothetical protein
MMISIDLAAAKGRWDVFKTFAWGILKFRQNRKKAAIG